MYKNIINMSEKGRNEIMNRGSPLPGVQFVDCTMLFYVYWNRGNLPCKA